MQSQGSSVFDAGYFSALAARVSAVDTCSDLQEIVNEAFASLQAEKNAIESQIAALLPLTSLPTDLGSVIKWITQLAAPYIAAYNNLSGQLTQTLAAISSLDSAINEAISRIEGCAATIPTIV